MSTQPTLIALDALGHAPENMRRTRAHPDDDAALKASIATKGLLQNLVVRADDDGTYLVCAGARRLEALRALAAEGAIEPDAPVLCVVRNGEDRDTADTIETSLSENLHRAAPHPADEVRAFKALADEGLSAKAIAARHGLSERAVAQRLRLGALAPEILEAFREGAFGLDVAKAFAGTDDHERQRTAYREIVAAQYAFDTWDVKRRLSAARVPGHAKLAQFVGADAYREAGGVIAEDLFAMTHEEGTWFEDGDLLERLARARLEREAERLRPDWRWVEVHTEWHWHDQAKFGRIEPTESEATPEEREELRAITEEMTAIDARDEATAEVDDRYAALEERKNAIECAIDARAYFTEADRALAGCIVTIAHDGTVDVIMGRVRPEHLAETEAPEETQSEDGTPAPRPVVQGPMIETPSRTGGAKAGAKHNGLSRAQTEDLRAVRTSIVKAHLAKCPELALDLLVFQTARDVFARGYYENALKVSAEKTPLRPYERIDDEGFAAQSPGETMLADTAHLELGWLEAKRPFAAFRALRAPAKHALLAEALARTLNGQLANDPDPNPEFEATVRLLEIPFPQLVRPTAMLWWGRITKARALEIARETLGPVWADEHAKDKKDELAEALETAFGAHTPPEGANADKVAAWVYPGFVADEVEDD